MPEDKDPAKEAMVERWRAYNQRCSDEPFIPNEELQMRLLELCEAIQMLCLGSVEWAVQDAAGRALIASWNDHTPENPIDEAAELSDWHESNAQPKLREDLPWWTVIGRRYAADECSVHVGQHACHDDAVDGFAELVLGEEYDSLTWRNKNQEEPPLLYIDYALKCATEPQFT
jgi:hypothetical protein